MLEFLHPMETLKTSHKAIITAIVLILLLVVIWIVPKWQVYFARATFDRESIEKLEPKDRAQLDKGMIEVENRARLTLAQIIGGIVLIGIISAVSYIQKNSIYQQVNYAAASLEAMFSEEHRNISSISVEGI